MAITAKIKAKIKAKAKPKSTVKHDKTKQHKKEDAKSKGNRFQWFPPQQCKSCKQSTHDEEMSPPSGQEGMFLIWSRTRYCKELKIPRASGFECFRCYDVRRRFYRNEDDQILPQNVKFS